MDPFSITVGLVGTVAVAIHTSRRLKELIENLRDGPRQFAEAEKDVTSFTAVMISFEELFRGNGMLEPDGIISALVANIGETIGKCVKVLEDLENLIQRNVKPVPVGDEKVRFKWRTFTAPLRDNPKDIKELMNRLESGKSMLTMTLTAINTVRHANMQAVVANVNGKVELIKESTGNLLAVNNDTNVQVHDISHQVARLYSELKHINSGKFRTSKKTSKKVTDTESEFSDAVKRFLESTTMPLLPRRTPSPVSSGWTEVEASLEEPSNYFNEFTSSERPKPGRRLPSDFHPTDTSVYSGRHLVPDLYVVFSVTPPLAHPEDDAADVESPEIHGTARNADAESVRALKARITSGWTDVIAGEDGRLVLHEAAGHGQNDIVKILLDANRDYIDSTDDFGDTPLHYAVWQGFTETAHLLLQNGADSNAVDDKTWTPLNLACYRDNTQIAIILLRPEYGCRVDLHGPFFITPLMWAIKNENEDLVSALLSRGAQPTAKDRFDQTALHYATAYGFTAGMKLLLRHKWDLNAETQNGARPLHIAAQYGQAGATRVLLDHGGDPDRCTEEGWSALHQAAARGHANVVEVLLERCWRAQIEVRGKYRKTALIWAAEIGQLDSVNALLEHGADPNAQDTFGESALHYAAANGMSAVVERLVVGGSNVLLRNNRMEQPIHSSTCARGGLYGISKYLIEHGADVAAVDRVGDTALHKAVKCGNKRLTRLLLDSGANSSATNNSGERPLAIAISSGRGDIATLLQAQKEAK